MTEMVERVAEGVDKVAEDVAEMLPEGGKLRGAVEFVEHVAELTAKDAHLVEGFIDKVLKLLNDSFPLLKQAYLLTYIDLIKSDEFSIDTIEEIEPRYCILKMLTD